MALTCIIVDDEPLAVKLLESFVAKTPDLELLGSFTDSVEAINAIKQLKPQLLFLDIQMPDLNGMELAHMLPEGTRIIFTTAFKEYAFESYEVSPSAITSSSLLLKRRVSGLVFAVKKRKRPSKARPHKCPPQTGTIPYFLKSTVSIAKWHSTRYYMFQA